MTNCHLIVRFAPALVAGVVAGGLSSGPLSGQEGIRFRSGVDLVNVTATVTDRSGRFVAGLRQADFTVYENNQPVDVTHFSNERVPVSFGIVLDTSGSMAGDKIRSARAAIERFLDRLLNPDDEAFLLGFSGDVTMIQAWTTNRDAISTSLQRVQPVGGTAMYDAVLEAVTIAQSGRHGKKAIVVISDGNDTSSHASAAHVRQLVRESEVLVYAVGIDGTGEPVIRTPPPTSLPTPIPFPGRRRPRWPFPQFAPRISLGGNDRLNVDALRQMTDSSGGRTEVVRSARDLDRATASIADELSQQYSLGYVSPGERDGRWHAIRVEVRDPSLRVRARRGYTAAS
jgi:Ca-activated chloride channel family protein